MPQYRLSGAAKGDLILIAKWGDENHGVEKSNQYRENLKEHFAFLAENPLLYPAIDHIKEGYRRSVRGVHSVYYRIDGDTVEIMAVIGRQDRGKWL